MASTPTDEQRLRDLALLRRVRDRMDREYAQPLDVEALARGVNMSAGHLSRQFKLAYGESPYAYLMTRRIERAMALSGAVADYAAAHEAEVDFAMWLQWQLEFPLSVQRRASEAGMSIGILHDLAVGVHPGGADAWRLRNAYATGIRVGAPRTPSTRSGRTGSSRRGALTGWRVAYAPFRDLIANVLQHAGGVRIDHIIGLFRLWWTPEGRPPAEGTYVRYDHEALIGILALEAQRAGAVIVGEDLGVVEPSAREYLAERGVLGTSILWFERDEDGRPLPAKQWRKLCLASVTTHDLPPTAGYLAGVHVRLRTTWGC